jgi:hypothetical protein
MFIIKDWAGNYPFGRKTFPDFETAWGFLYEQYSEVESEDEFNAQMGEFYVEQRN